MRRTLLVITGVALLIAWAAPAHADLILLKDGRIFERSGMERVEGGVKVHFENGDVVVPESMIETAALENQPDFVPTTPEEKAKFEKGLVPFEGKWVKASKRDALVQKRIAERKAAIEEIRKHVLWRHKLEGKTKHFEFHYTVPPHIYEYFRDLMEAYYKEFAKTWKIKQPKDYGRLLVCFYANRGDFLQISGIGGGGALAYFKFVKPLELNFYYDRTDRDLTEQVMYHEVNHYLQLLLDPKFNMPHFPSEALAEYYGASKFDPKTKKLETGLVLEGRLTEIQMDVLNDEMMGLEKMLSAEMYAHYYWGWSLVHFLMNDKSHRKKFEKFVKDLVAGKGVRHEPYGMGFVTVPMPKVWEHFKRCYGLKSDEDVKVFEEAWHAYVKDNLKLVTSRGLEKAAVRAMNAGRDIRAKRLFKEAIEKGSDTAMTYHHYAELLEQKGGRTEAIEYRKKALELAPLEASLYAELGRALRFGGGDEEEGKRLMKLALELDPDNPYLKKEIERLEKEGS
jgi:tetratricopeptide (TPR) repeat protein